jgi:hypothetical protein
MDEVRRGEGGELSSAAASDDPGTDLDTCRGNAAHGAATGIAEARRMFDQESAQIRQQQKFLHDVESGIRDANRRLIHAKIPNLNRQSFVAFATAVAALRAEYLEAALALANAQGDEAKGMVLRTLRTRREAFEEARDAFAALERAIERGYVDMG